jgi:hypothetical protein
LAFPVEGEKEFESFKAFWFKQVVDNIQSVRENSSIALASVIKSETYASEIKKSVMEFVK